MADPVPSIQQQLGIPSDVPFGDKVYKLGPSNQKVVAAQEKLMVALARAKLKERKESMEPGEWWEDYQAHLDRVDRGHYAAGGPGWTNMLLTPEGWTIVYLSLFRVNHPEMTVEVVKEIEKGADLELNTALAEQLPGFFAFAYPDRPAEFRDQLASQLIAGLAKRRLTTETPVANGTAP